MLSDSVELGPVPGEEPCPLPGTAHYAIRSRSACAHHIFYLRAVMGFEPVGASLEVAEMQGDRGVVYTVVCRYDPDHREAIAYALRCEAAGPTTWKEE